MADESVQSSGDTTDATGSGSGGSTGSQTLTSLEDAVKNAIAGAGDEVLAGVISHYADAEKARRIKLLVSGVDAQRQAQADLNKIDRPTNYTYNADGSIFSQTYDKASLTAIKKAKDRIEKLTAAINAVIASPSNDTYKKLDDTIKKGGKGGDAKDNRDEAEGDE